MTKTRLRKTSLPRNGATFRLWRRPARLIPSSSGERSETGGPSGAEGNLHSGRRWAPGQRRFAACLRMTAFKTLPIGAGAFGVEGRAIGAAGEARRNIEGRGLAKRPQGAVRRCAIDRAGLRIHQGRPPSDPPVGRQGEIDLDAELVRTGDITRQNPVRIDLIEDRRHLRPAGL